MMQKKLLYQAFHERTYLPQPLEEFEKEAWAAKALGAEYMFIGEIPKNHREWDSHPGDPYPNWGMLLTSLFKLVVPRALEDALDVQYARRNLALLKSRAEILKKVGLCGALTLSEPFYLPEQVYRMHPAWRGPRCDHPRRSKEAYYSPCIDEPEVLALYAEAMDVLCTEIDIGYLRIITNDSGAGVCWSEGLYNGANGPERCRHIALGERLLKFLGVFQEAAHRHGRLMTVDLTSHIIGFKEADSAMESVWNRLDSSQIVNGRNARGEIPVAQVSFGLYEHYRPLRCIPETVDFLERFDEAMKAPGEAVLVTVRESEFGEYNQIMDEYLKNPPGNAAEKNMLLLRVAEQIAKERFAGHLLEVWKNIDRAFQMLRQIWLDNFVMMPLVSQRLLTRPLVPEPQLLSEEEFAYFKRFLFQATSEEQARDLMNIQGMDFIRGFSGTRMASLSMKEALGQLKKACGILDAIGSPGMSMLRRRLLVVQRLILTMLHGCQYQLILDATGSEEKPELKTVWPVRGDDRLHRMNEIARAEIDNCYALADLMEGYETELMVLADTSENEDIFMMSPDIVRQIRRKAGIMLDHMRDAERIFETDNR